MAGSRCGPGCKRFLSWPSLEINQLFLATIIELAVSVFAGSPSGQMAAQAYYTCCEIIVVEQQFKLN